MLKDGVDHDRDEPAPHIRSAATQRARWLAYTLDARAVNLFDVALLPGGAAGELEAVGHGWRRFGGRHVWVLRTDAGTRIARGEAKNVRRGKPLKSA